MSKAEVLLWKNRCDYVAAEEALIKQYRESKVTQHEYIEIMSDLNEMHTQAMEKQEKLRELNASIDTMTFDDWETVFLAEIM